MNTRMVGIVMGLLALTACGDKEQMAKVQTVAVERHDIIVDAEATGVVEPINVIEVKSKASGQIERMPVETGTAVKPGELLVQVDTRDVRNQYNQTVADVRAAEAKVAVSGAQRKRSEELFSQQIITAQEHEASTLDFANAQAQLARAEASLDLAKQRLEDATVRAPVAGTIIEKSVSLGQVITSATGAFGGGTLLLKMADLNQVRVRALVNETDIGNVQSGQQATVTVDAYPDRPFRGVVEKIEPQAVVQQSVTMFPVLISVSNREGLLKPGMNGEVSVLIERRDNVLAVPNDALRTPRDIAAASATLNLNPDSVRLQIQAQFASMGRGQEGGPSGDGGQIMISRGDVAMNGESLQDQQGSQGRGMPQPTAEQCSAVRSALDKKPELRAKLDAVRDRMRVGEMDLAAARSEMQTIFTQLGVDGRIARMCTRPAGMQRAEARDSAPGLPARPAATAPAQGSISAGQQRTEHGGAGAGAASGRRGNSRLVFVAGSGTFAPRLVNTGVSNYDYTEIVSGLKEGEQVAIISSAALQLRRQEQLERFRGMTGGGVPGMQRQTTGAAGAGAAGGGGGGGGGQRGGRGVP